MIYEYLLVSLFVFALGILGVLLNRSNVIRFLLSIELMLLAVNINFVTASVLFNDLAGWVFMIIVLTLGAAELAIGLSILIVYYRNFNNLDSEMMNKLKG